MTDTTLAPLTASADYKLPSAEAAARKVLRTVKRTALILLFVPTLLAIAFRLSHGVPLTDALPPSSVLDSLVLSTLFLTIVGSVITMLVVSAKANRVALAQWKAHNYAWYCKAFPGNVTANGDVTCRHCGGGHVSVKNLMNRTFMRAHACNRCGETLYYSPELT